MENEYLRQRGFRVEERGATSHTCKIDYNGLTSDIYSKYLCDTIEESLKSFDKLINRIVKKRRQKK